MRFKVNNKYIVDAKSYDDAIRAIKMLDTIRDKHVIMRIPMRVERAVENIARVLGIKYDISNGTYTFSSASDADTIVEKVYQQTGIHLIKNYPTSITKTEYFDSVKDGKYVSDLKPGDVITKKDGSKWNVVLVRHTPFGIQVRVKSETSPVKTEEITYRPTDMLADGSCKDVEPEADVDLDFLIKDEIEAIDGYRKMIAKTSNPQLLSVLSHILDEETEHVEELRAAQAGVYKVEDD